jgi:hypothetical protein
MHNGTRMMLINVPVPSSSEGPPVVSPQKYVIVTLPQNVQMPVDSEPFLIPLHFWVSPYHGVP